MYKFNAKELDESTGYYYYGACYYDPAVSIFLSVDPLAEQFPNYNPYTYTMNNPVNLVDPTGMSAQNPGEGDPVKKPSGSNTNFEGLSATLDEIVINLQRGVDKLSSDWEKNKEKSGYNHFKNYGQNNRFGFVKIYGNSNENGGFSNRGIINNLTVEANQVGRLGGAGGASLTGLNFFSKFMGWTQSFMDGFSIGNSLAGEMEGWFRSDKIQKHTFDGFKVKNPNSPYIVTPQPFRIEPEQRDTVMKESQIRSTDWNAVRKNDSLNKLKHAGKLNVKYDL